MLRLLAFPVLLIVSISPSIHSYDPKHDFLVNDEVNQQSNVIPKQTYVDLAKKYGLDPKKIVCYPSPDHDGSCIMTYIGKVTQAYPISMMYHPGGKPRESKRARFYLHTKKTQNLEKPIELFVDADEGDNGAAKEFFNPDGPVKILAHGYHCNINLDFPKDMMEDYIEYVPDVNVILVDWAKQAGNPELKLKLALLTDYNDAAGNTEFVGKRAATLVKRLVAEKFTSLDKIHFIGHSLGSHVAGFTGFYMKPDKMGRITGLDPAAPGFCLMKDQTRRLTSEDAEFVDIIHTDGGNLCNMNADFTASLDTVVMHKVGLSEKLGHVDFYPNGGISQPGCDEFYDSCSHQRSHQLMRSTINPANTFLGRRSTGWLAYLNDEGPLNETALMGERCTNKARGMYYLKTGGEFPYLPNES